MSFKITWKIHITCSGFAILTLILLGDMVENILIAYFDNVIIFYPTVNLVLNFYFQIILLMIPISIIHEILHGSMYKLFGGKVKYGFKGIYAYTQEVSGLPIQRTKFLIVLLMPIVIISIISVLLPGWLGGIVYLLNLLGSSGDLFMSFKICMYKSTSRIIDRKYGFDIV